MDGPIVGGPIEGSATEGDASVGVAAAPTGEGPARLRASGLVIPVVALALGLWLASRSFGSGRQGADFPAGQALWAVLLVWLAALLLTGSVRARHESKLQHEADAGGGRLLEPPSALLWPAVVLGVLWRTVLFVTPGLALGWYAVIGSSDYQETQCRTGYGQCISGAITWIPLAVILVVAGAVLAVLSARRSVRNARRRIDGLPPQQAATRGLTKAATGAYRAPTYTPPAEPSPASAPEGAAAAPGAGERIERLTELASLHERGVIDGAELERLKAEVLAEDG